MMRLFLVSLPLVCALYCPLGLGFTVLNSTSDDVDNGTGTTASTIQLLGGFTDQAPYGSGQIVVYGCYRQSFPNPCSGNASRVGNFYWYTGRSETPEAITAWLNRDRPQLTSSNPTGYKKQICIGRGRKDVEVNPAAYCTWVDGIAPGGACTVANQILIDHGPINVGKLNGQRAESTINVVCSGTAGSGYTLSLMGEAQNGDGRIHPDLLSRMYIDETYVAVNGVGFVAKPAASRSFTLSSVLIDRGIATGGVYQWSGVLVLNLI